MGLYIDFFFAVLKFNSIFLIEEISNLFCMLFLCSLAEWVFKLFKMLYCSHLCYPLQCFLGLSAVVLLKKVMQHNEAQTKNA